MGSYDIIGDLHGCATKLHGLLGVLGWAVDGRGTYRHPDPGRRVIFVGDLVDRGPEQRATLECVKAMVDAGSALIVMGNHEFNAVSYATEHPDRPDTHLRDRSEKNADQHREFLDQLDDRDRARWVDWFRTLPIWLDLGDLRVVHACWHRQSIDILEREFGGNRFPAGDAGFVLANKRGSEAENPTDARNGRDVWAAIEVLLKGPEVGLEDYGLPAFLDKGCHARTAARARWWNASASRLADLIDIPPGAKDEHFNPYPPIPDVECSSRDRSFTYTDTIPVVYGHHWREWEPEEHLDWTLRTACVDFSAVNDGPLVAYQWRGEQEIDPCHYVGFNEALVRLPCP